VTPNRKGIRSANAATWVITPTMREPGEARFSRVLATTSSVPPSSVPNPSFDKADGPVDSPSA
jgi:hypothetical protein